MLKIFQAFFYSKLGRNDAKMIQQIFKRSIFLVSSSQLLINTVQPKNKSLIN